MVVLTIVTQKNGDTIFFDEQIPEVHFMKLISCSLYNSRYNLKKAGQVFFKDNKEVLASIPSGHYTYQLLTKDMAQGLEEFKNIKKIKLETNRPYCLVKITVLEPTIKRGISLSPSLQQLFDSGPALTTITCLKKLNSPSYFIHCDLINRNFNFVNNKKSDLLAKIDVKGQPYEKVRYDASPQQPIRDCSTSSHVNSITISVRDQDGELFDFKDMPLEFELDLN